MKGRRVDVLEVASPADDLSKLETELSLRPALIIDGLFGIGLNRPFVVRIEELLRFLAVGGELGIRQVKSQGRRLIFLR